MVDIAEIGRNQLRQALTGDMKHCEVTEWQHEGKPVKIYWRPLTGQEQAKVDEAANEVNRICLMLQVRARDENGNLIFDKTPLESLKHDYDFDVIRTIVFLMLSDMGQDSFEDHQAELAKE